MEMKGNQRKGSPAHKNSRGRILVPSQQHREDCTCLCKSAGCRGKNTAAGGAERSGIHLVGFGSGIYSATFDPSVLELADRLPQVAGKKAFLFSTYGAPAFVANRKFVEKNHSQIRKKLQAKGYTVIGEFGCAGWNTNSFLKYFGGLNKGKPDAEDIRNAEAFARDMKEKARG